MSFRDFRAAVVCALAVLASSPVAVAGPDTECPQLPPSLTLDMWEPILVGDRVYRVGLSYVPGGGGGSGDSSAGGSIEVNLLSQYIDPETRETRTSSFVRGLAPVFSLRAGDTELGSGTLAPTLTSLGAGYGATVPVGETDPSTSLELGVAFDPNAVDPYHDEHPDHEDPCAALPEWMELAVGVSLSELLSGMDLDGPDASATNNFRMSLLGSLDPRPADNYSNIWGWNDGTTYLAIIGSTGGTTFVDVTDPQQPTSVGFVAGPSSSWREIKTYRDWAYIVTEGSGAGEGLQIVDLSNPLSPTLANTYSATFQTAHTLFIDETTGLAYINGTNNGLRLLELEPDPVHPVESGAWNVRYVHDSQARAGFACFSEIYEGLQEIYDTSDPSNLVLLGSWSTPGAFTHNCWANPAETLLVTTDENNPGGALTVYDISSLSPSAPPPLLARYQPNPLSTVHNAYFEDDDPHRVAMSHYGLGARLIDLYRPTRPVELGGYDTYPSGDSGYNGAWGMYNYDPRGYFYVSDIQSGLFVVRYDPTGGTLSGFVVDGTSDAAVAQAQVVVLESGAVATTGEDGAYAVYAPAGTVSLRVTVPGYRSRLVHAGSMPLGGRLDADVELVPLPRTALSGAVRRSDTSGPIEGAVVKIAGTTLSTTSAFDGTWSFPEVAIGQQSITAEAFGFSPAEVRVGLAEGIPGSADLVLEPGRFVDDAETNQVWTLGVPGDSATSGVWTRVDPNGTANGTVQPEDDHTPAPGVTAFITGQSAPGAGAEANDVENGVTTLLSPSVTVSDLGAARVGYHRWVSTNAGSFSGGRLLVQISPDNGGTWQTLEAQSANANAWTRRDFDIGSIVPMTGSVRVRFRAEPNSPASFTVLEAGVDDFEIVRVCGVRFNPTSPDADRDGTVDGCDACPTAMGDDLDGDGVCGDADNAPFVPNAGQADSDLDGVGDPVDNCAGSANADQRDLDGDGAGDSCDGDADGDGLLDGSEDLDRDGDGIEDGSDVCATVPDVLQRDRDLDGDGDACDPDDGEVFGLRFAAGDRLVWEPEDGAAEYHLYRGDLGAPALVALAGCLADAVEHEYAIDGTWPVPGDGFFYLVSRMGLVEGSLGRASDGSERNVTSRCP